MVSSRGILIASFIPVAASVSPAGDFNDRAARLEIYSIVASIRISLQVAFEVCQELLRTVAASRLREVVDFVRVITIADVSPESGQSRAADRRVDQLHLSVIGMNDF